MIDLDMQAGRTTIAKTKIVSGSTFEMGVPKSKHVRIYSRVSGALIASTRSDKNGVYKAYLPLDASYTIVAIDEHKKFNAVIQDNVVPK
ncbi:hypothetical protein [Acinetobacter sp. YH12112]|uniref:hypothetical protein n=1 Tax=Acinetobacter sp. YH12112 TaxID=2601099 RepID=UPI0015D37246|nr:hypothetical protein [Acinetobacter sp. YH12112]